MSPGTASVDDAFRDTLVVKSVDLLHADLVLEKSGADALGARGLQPDVGCKIQSG